MPTSQVDHENLWVVYWRDNLERGKLSNANPVASPAMDRRNARKGIGSVNSSLTESKVRANPTRKCALVYESPQDKDTHSGPRKLVFTLS